MKFTKPNLEAALRTVSNTVGSGGSDISTHYLFRASEAGGLEVLSANGRTWSSCPIKDAQVEDSARFTLEAKRVHCLLDSAAPSDRKSVV